MKEDDTTIFRLLEDLADLTAGAVAVLLPLFILAVPCAVLVIVPLAIAGGVAAAAGALLALPFVPLVLLVRAVRRR